MNYKRTRALSMMIIATASGAMAQVILPATVFANQAAIPAAFMGSAATSNPVKSAESALREMGESVHRTKTAAVDLVRECTREDTMMAGGEIDFIGTDVIPILPDTAEGLGGPQFLPPRRSYINLHMSQLMMMLPILANDIKNTKSPDPSQAAQTATYDSDMEKYLQDAMLHYSNLKGVTVAPPYDTNTIVAEAKALHKDIDEIDKIRKRVYGEIKHDPNDKKIEKQAEGQKSS